MPTTEQRCRICGSDTTELTTIHSDFSSRDFFLRRCDVCGLVFVTNPREDFASLYDEAYYRGEGADSSVHYTEEMGSENTIREYEWRGITRVVEYLCEGRSVRWLDFGCGLGGLVKYARANGFPNTYGFDQGWGADWAREHRIELLDEAQLDELSGSFDVVTAIEVLEHIPDPLQPMEQIASLLKPGGVFFATTGNAAPHRDSFRTWGYVLPDVHVSYFEPRTLAEAYRRAGLEPVSGSYLPGYDDIIRYKILKTVGRNSRNLVERLIPWPLAGRLADRRYGVSQQPHARRPTRDCAFTQTDPGHLKAEDPGRPV